MNGYDLHNSKLKFLTTGLFLFLFFLNAYGYFGLDMSLEERGEYFLPLWETYTPSPIDPDTSYLDFLNYDKLNVHRTVTVDFQRGLVYITEDVNGHQVYAPRVMSIEDFMDYLAEVVWARESMAMAEVVAGEKAGGITWEIPVKFPKIFESFIGEGGAALSVHGRRRIEFSGRSQWNEGDIATGGHTVSKWPSLNMEQESQFTITGTIGSKISVKVDQDSERMTELENTINIKYQGTEDDVVQLIEAGNTTLSLPGATYAGYTERVQGLFGIKSEFQIGDWSITAIASQEKSEHKTAQFRAGARPDDFYFYDYNFLKRTYFFVDSAFRYGGMAAGDSISEFQLYKSPVSDPLSYFKAVAYVNPDDHSAYPGEGGDTTKFERISLDDYEIFTLQGYMRMRREGYIRDEDILACAYVLKHDDGTADTVGTVVPEDFAGVDTTLVLNLIKDEDSSPDNFTWEYEWRNVYKPAGDDIDVEGLEMLIYLGDTSQENTDNFLTQFGLDLINSSGASTPDGKVDPLRISPARGEIIFPVLHPFDPRAEDVAILPDLALLDTKVPVLYDSDDEITMRQGTHYSMKGSVKSRQVSTSLGNMNIIEGSERVTLNGEKLKRGVDYEIEYLTGTITFLSEEARDPNANIRVDYEYEPFFQPEQKTLLGTRVEYRFNDDSWIGSTALYKSASASARRPRLGGEPSRTFIWDADLALNFKPEIFTDWVNAIPLITTEAESRLQFQAEVAQVFSNPNIKGEAYLDDFEGSRNELNLGIRRTVWTLASPPHDQTHRDRGRLWWYNPYNRVKVSEIWPEKETTSEESKVNVLMLDFEDTTSSTNGWAGVMRYLSPGYQDQSHATFIELWVKGDEGVLHIDLGEISEDIDGDGVYDTEDKLRNGIRDGVLQEDEDVGLDGLADANENDTLSWGTPGDPHGDNWEYDDDDHYDYSKINGTEENHYDPEGGKRPDTEDLNSNDECDKDNNYYEYVIDLSSDLFEVPGTRSEYGWRLYRIPFLKGIAEEDPDARPWVIYRRGDPDSSDIEYARLWVTEADTAKIWIASLNIVGNDWETISDHYNIFTKSTHEDQDYYPPPGISAERDPNTGLRYAEQSLSIKYEDIPPTPEDYPDSAEVIYNILTEKEDFTYYEKLEMFVHWNDSLSDEIQPVFFFRMGTDANNYYEYNCKLYSGWDERNSIVIDFPALTALKNELLNDADSLNNDGETDYGYGEYRIKGSPSLTYIKVYYIGVYNPDESDSISGEIWIDELRLTDVRKTPGWAQRAYVNVEFADLLDVSSSLERKDSEFHSLTTSKGTGTTNTVRTFTASLKGHKFFPCKWNLNLPFDYTYSHNVSLPRLKSGSDIVLPKELREDEKTLTERHTFRTSIQATPETDNFWMNMTVNRLRHTFSLGHNYGYSPSMELDENSNYTITQVYDLTPKNEYKAYLLNWIADSLPSFFRDLELNYAPTKLVFNTTVSGTKKHQKRSSNHIRDETRDLTHDFSFNTRPFPSLTTTFALNLKRNLMENFLFGADGIKFGTPLSKNINTGIDYSYSGLDFLTQRYSYNTRYGENTNPSQTSGDDVYGSATLRQTFNISMTLNLKKLLPDTKKGGKEEESPSILMKTVGLLGHLKPIQGTYERTKNSTYPALTGSPTLLFKMGFADNPGVSSSSAENPGQSNVGKTITNTIKANTGTSLFWDIDASIAFNYRGMNNIIDKQRETSLIFPDIGLKSSKIQELFLFKHIARSAYLNSGFKYTVDKKYREEAMTSNTWKREFTPIFSLDLNWNIGIKTKISQDYSISVSQEASSVNLTQNTESALNLQVSYSFRATKGFKVPILNKTIKFENSLNTSLTVTKSLSKSEYGPTRDDLTPRTKTNTLRITPSADYNFSRNIRGGLDIEYENRDDMNNKHRIRGASIWAEISF